MRRHDNAAGKCGGKQDNDQQFRFHFENSGSGLINRCGAVQRISALNQAQSGPMSGHPAPRPAACDPMPGLPVVSDAFALPVTGVPHVPPVIPAPMSAIPRITCASGRHGLVAHGGRRTRSHYDDLRGGRRCDSHCTGGDDGGSNQQHANLHDRPRVERHMWAIPVQCARRTISRQPSCNGGGVSATEY
jgi:hypothetical protein